MIKTIAFLVAGTATFAVTVSLSGEAEKPAEATIVASNVSCRDGAAPKTSIHLQTCRLEIPR